MSGPSDALAAIRDHAVSEAARMASEDDTEALVRLVEALADELVRVARVAEQRILTDLAPEPPQG